MFIKEWWENRDKVTLIARPRRFGKTLNMSMLNSFFSFKYKGREELFEGLSIWEDEKYRKIQGTYPIIFLSFAAIKAGNYSDVKKQINAQICTVYEENRYLLDGNLLSANLALVEIFIIRGQLPIIWMKRNFRLTGHLPVRMDW